MRFSSAPLKSLYKQGIVFIKEITHQGKRLCHQRRRAGHIDIPKSHPSVVHPGDMFVYTSCSHFNHTYHVLILYNIRERTQF